MRIITRVREIVLGATRHGDQIHYSQLGSQLCPRWVMSKKENGLAIASCSQDFDIGVLIIFARMLIY
jgi:hypothetical protein